MKNILLRGVLVTALATGAGAMFGCTANADVTAGEIPPRTGSVTIRWSVDGSFDPAACDAFAAAEARVDIYDDGGQPIFTGFTDCRSFTSTTNLSPGRYSARIEMVDSRQQPRSTSIPISSFTVIADTNLVLDTDFPRTSFF